MWNIGVAVSTFGREEVFKYTLNQIKKFTPDAKIVVVQDFNGKRLKEADYYFEERAGIAKVKNKCLELLNNCQHIFLFDDDTYPIKEEWYKPYVESKHKHLMYLYGNKIRGFPQEYDENTVFMNKPRGCMLYFDRSVVEPFDETFGLWGGEHEDLSRRISGKFLDVKNSKELIYSMDEHREVKSTIPIKEKISKINKLNLQM